MKGSSTNGLFPEGFFWGTATAAHQIEGKNIQNDFWKWETDSGKVPDSGDACGQYENYQEDFDNIKNILNNNAYRFSVEWSRIEPTEGVFDEREINHYKHLISELKRRHIEPFLTLHHFTNPLWFAKKGGWEKKDNIKYFERFAGVCAKAFGNLVNYWITINEPGVYASFSSLNGYFPPHKKSVFTTVKVYFNLISAHKKAFKAIKEVNPGSKVGSAINMVYYRTINFMGKLLLPVLRFIANFSFISLSRRQHDFIGINHYFIYTISLKQILNLKNLNPYNFKKILDGKMSDLGWIIYPRGIYEVVSDTWKKYGLPIYITENGIADREDKNRPGYIRNYLEWLHAAIADGADVRGYFHWSLMDNIEWGLGTKACFGLFETDFKTLKRIPRKSAFLYGQIAAANALI